MGFGTKPFRPLPSIFSYSLPHSFIHWWGSILNKYLCAWDWVRTVGNLGQGCLPTNPVQKMDLGQIIVWWKVKVKVAQLCLTLCHPMVYAAHGVLQARILEWVANPFSSRSSQPRDRTQVSCIAGGFFSCWVPREAQESNQCLKIKKKCRIYRQAIIKTQWSRTCGMTYHLLSLSSLVYIPEDRAAGLYLASWVSQQKIMESWYIKFRPLKKITSVFFFFF